MSVDIASLLTKTAGGAVKGGMSGGAAGAAVGAGLSLATGLVQEFKANKLKNAADSAYPGLVDPSQAGFLAELDQKRRSMETGSAFQTGMDAVDEANAGANASVVKSTGGDVGSTIQSLLQAQRGANTAKNQVLANGQQAQAGYDQMYGGLLNQISARKLQLQMQKSQQNLAEWSKMKQGANQNTQAGMAGLLGGGGQSNNAVDAGRDTAIDTQRGINLLPENMASQNTPQLPVTDISNMPLAV